MEYDKYTDQLYAQREFLYIDYLYEVFFGYSFHELNYAEIRLKGGQNENKIGIELANAARAFGYLYTWTVVKFGVVEGKMYPLNRYFSWIDEDNIVEKLKSRVPEFKIPERAIEFMAYVKAAHQFPEPEINQVTKQKESGPLEIKKGNGEASFFPAPGGTNWGQIGFLITESAQVQISIKGKMKTYSTDKFNEVFSSQKSRDLLLNIIHKTGVFSAEDFEGAQKENLKQYVSTLRGDLKTLFGIQTDPIKSTGKGEYQTMFSCCSQLRFNHE